MTSRTQNFKNIDTDKYFEISFGHRLETLPFFFFLNFHLFIYFKRGFAIRRCPKEIRIFCQCQCFWNCVFSKSCTRKIHARQLTLDNINEHEQKLSKVGWHWLGMGVGCANAIAAFRPVKPWEAWVHAFVIQPSGSPNQMGVGPIDFFLTNPTMNTEVSIHVWSAKIAMGSKRWLF